MKLYRFDDMTYSTVSISVSGNETYGSTPVQLELREFDVISETPCGYWISYEFTKKWVRKRGRFAQESIEDARKDFLRRKRIQIRIFTKRLQRAQEATWLAENSKERIIQTA